MVPGLEIVFAPEVDSSAISNSRNDPSASSLRTPISTHVTRAFSAAVRSIDPTCDPNSSNDHTSRMEIRSSTNAIEAHCLLFCENSSIKAASNGATSASIVRS